MTEENNNERRSPKDRRRFARLSDRRKELSDGISNLAWFEVTVGVAVVVVLCGYGYVLTLY